MARGFIEHGEYGERGRPGRLAPLQLLIGIGVVLGLASPGLGQSKRYPPEPVDYDDQAEDDNRLWGRVLAPNRERYHAEVDRAMELVRVGNPQSLTRAAEVLRKASEMAPDETRAFWLLGRVEERREKWPACATAYARAADLAPDYRPKDDLPKGRDPAWALDVGMAWCQTNAGMYEEAIANYKRILGSGLAQRATLYRHLGETYMALGRLSEAIEVFSVALRRSPGDVRTIFALATAYDRDEKEALARLHLDDGLAQNRSMAQLTSADAVFIPAADKLYSLGLAHEARGDVEWAILYFREYLATTGKGPWERRVQHHLGDLVREPLDARRVRFKGTGMVDPGKTVRAITSADPALQRCMASVPGLLLEVRITVVGKASRRNARSEKRRAKALREQLRGLSPMARQRVLRARARRGQSSVAPTRGGVASDVLRSYSVTDEAIRKARSCVEAVADTLAIPRPDAGKGSYNTVSFPVISRQPPGTGH